MKNCNRLISKGIKTLLYVAHSLVFVQGIKDRDVNDLIGAIKTPIFCLLFSNWKLFFAVKFINVGKSILLELFVPCTLLHFNIKMMYFLKNK